MSKQSNSLTKVAVTYEPPTFKFEYIKMSTNQKYHKKVDLTTFIEGGCGTSSISVTHNTELSYHITKSLIQRYSELLQIPSLRIECLIQKLIRTNPAFTTEKDTMTTDRCIHVQPMQVNMSINKGSLLVSPLQEKSKLQRHTAVYDSDQERDLLADIGDLNQASEEELAVAKGKMNEVFEKCQILPADVEYIYDKRVDFEKPDEESSWD